VTAIPRVVIAAPGSGAGKTTVATGLMAALRQRGLQVSPHKVGPDYIDPGYHGLAAGRPGRNLDPVMVGEQLVAPLFLHGARGCDVAVIEGVMGLFDGRGSTREGSTAHVAHLLAAPVLLVVDASSQSSSVAALVHGFMSYDDELNVAGVILNRVATDRHEGMLRDALAGLLPGPVDQRVDDVVDVEPAPLQQVGELVQHQETVGLGGQVALDLLPALTGVRGVVLVGPVLAGPRPALAHLVPGDRTTLTGGAEDLERVLLTDPPLGALHELEDPDRPALVPRPQGHPERGRRLPLHLPGVDDEQWSVAPLPGGEPVLRYDVRHSLRHGQAALTTRVRTSADSSSRR
jgi:hypothetical protein